MNERTASRCPRLLVPIVAILVASAACSAGGPTTSPAPSPGASAPPASPTAVTSPISQADAIARVLAQQPRFAGIRPLDPNLIGQSAWYEVSPAAVGWRVIVTMGSGDCQAGCISRHSWTYDVDPDGTVRLVQETGDPVEGGTGDGTGGSSSPPPVAIPAQGGPWILGIAHAGPTCPVVRNPPDPSCAERPVAGAVAVIRDAGGAEVGRGTTGADGTFLVAVAAGGRYTVEAQPVEGLMGTPQVVAVIVPDGASAWVAADLAYDTGIR